MEWFIKANLNLAVLFLVYKLIIRFSGRHLLARFYLLATPVVSIVLPLLMVNTALQNTIPAVYLHSFTISAGAIQSQDTGFVSYELVNQFYWIGVIVSLCVTGFSVVKLVIKRSSIKTAYSFFNHIYIPDTSSEKSNMMLMHEEAHVKQWHTLDTIWYALVRALFWVNPLVYKLFGYLKEEHEYSADAYAVKKVGDTNAYCDLLLDETFGVSNISQLAHSFHSPISLLNRIKMITQTQPQSVAWWKRIVTVPLLGTLLLISIAGTDTFAQKIEGKIYESTDMPAQMPEFPGGQENMIKFLSTELKYPEKCRDQKIEGRVMLEFVVDKNGRVQNVKNLKEGVDPLLVKEAIRVVSAMPKWEPGRQNGESVNTKLMMPVVFKL